MSVSGLHCQHHIFAICLALMLYSTETKASQLGPDGASKSGSSFLLFPASGISILHFFEESDVQ